MRNLIILLVLIFHGIFLNSQTHGTLFTESARERYKVLQAGQPYQTTPDILLSVWNESNTEGLFASKNRFIANPATGRWDNMHGVVGQDIPTGVHTYDPDLAQGVTDDIFLAGIWAWINQDVTGNESEAVTVANTVINEILLYADDDDLDYSNGGATRLGGEPARTNTKHGSYVRYHTSGATQLKIEPFFYIASYMSRLFEMWEELEHIQTVLTAAEKERIEYWFLDYYRYQYALVDPFIGSDTHGFGSGYKDGNIDPKAGGATEFTGSGSTSLPIEDQAGTPNTNYSVAWAQDRVNNRLLKQIDYIHSYGISKNIQDGKKLGEASFEIFLRYSTWPDGTFAEMHRNDPTNPTVGISYGFVSIGVLEKMAHRQKIGVRAGFPSVSGEDENKLYNFTTSLGLTNGELLGGVPYWGSTTVGGNKNLKLLMTSITNYYRTPGNGGWNPERYYNGLLLDGGIDKRYSFMHALANIRYKDNDIKDFYTFNTGANYPAKGVTNNKRGGFGIYYNEDLFADMEDYFFPSATSVPATTTKATIKKKIIFIN